MTPNELHEKTVSCVKKWEAIIGNEGWENHLNTMRDEFKALDRELMAINKALETQSEPTAPNKISTYDPDALETRSSHKRKRSYDPDEIETNAKRRRPNDIDYRTMEDSPNNHFDAKMSFDHAAKEKMEAIEELLNDYRALLTPPLKLHRYT